MCLILLLFSLIIITFLFTLCVPITWLFSVYFSLHCSSLHERSLCCSSVLECFIRLHSSPWLVYYIFVVFMSHHFGVLIMCVSFHCACLPICLIILQFSPYVLHHIVLLSICALWYCISRHIYFITLWLCQCMPHYSIFPVYVHHYMLFSPYIAIYIADLFVCSLVHCCSACVCLNTLLFSIHMLHYIPFCPYVECISV